MNNKIFKRIVAAAAGVTMLGTCAFATGLTTASYSDGTLSFDYTVAEGASKVTYLAYAATVAGEGDTTFTTVNGTNYVLGNIVAVNQLDEIPEATSESVAISADLLGEATDIVLMSGDDLGSDVAYAVAPVVTAPTTEAYTVTFMDGTTVLDTKTEVAKDTVISTLVAAPSKDKGTAKLDWGFAGWYTDAELTTKLAADAVVTGDVTVYAKFVSNYIIGDVNADGAINNTDVTLVKQLRYGTMTETNINKFQAGKEIDANYYTFNGKDQLYKNGDVNGDGNINNTDVTLIKQARYNTMSEANKAKFGLGSKTTIK